MGCASDFGPDYYFPEGECPFWEEPFGVFGSTEWSWPEVSMESVWDIVSGVFDLPDVPRTRVPDVVISEQPSTVLPRGIGTERVPTQGDVWPDWSLEPILETRPGRTPDPYPGTEAARGAGTVDEVLGDPYEDVATAEQNDTLDSGDDTMAHDWNHLIRQGIAQVAGIGNGGSAQPQPGSIAYTEQLYAGLPPGSAIVSGNGAGANGCKRRRRRRLLTEGDFNDLMRIATLPNKDTVKVALAKAVGRR